MKKAPSSKQRSTQMKRSSPRIKQRTTSNQEPALRRSTRSSTRRSTRRSTAPKEEPNKKKQATIIH